MALWWKVTFTAGMLAAELLTYIVPVYVQYLSRERGLIYTCPEDYCTYVKTHCFRESCRGKLGVESSSSFGVPFGKAALD